VDLHCNFFGRDEFSDKDVTPFNLSFLLDRSIQVTARSKAWFCGSSLAGFEFRRKHGCLSLVNIVCCQVQVSATNRSLVQKSPTECACVGACVCVCLSVNTCKITCTPTMSRQTQVGTKKENLNLTHNVPYTSQSCNVPLYYAMLDLKMALKRRAETCSLSLLRLIKVLLCIDYLPIFFN
jgi:hypothetical protein